MQDDCLSKEDEEIQDLNIHGTRTSTGEQVLKHQFLIDCKEDSNPKQVPKQQDPNHVY